MDIHPVVLSGRTVRLEPCAESHVPGLGLTGKDQETWRYLPYGQIMGNEAMLAHVRWLLARVDAGTDLPFTIVNLETNQAIAATRFLEISCLHCRLEIGGTWYGRRFRRTAVKEGILRNHMILPDGHVRDSVYYSIISDEWSGIKSPFIREITTVLLWI